MHDAALPHDGEAVGEHRLILGGKACDDIRANGNLRPPRVQALRQRLAVEDRSVERLGDSFDGELKAFVEVVVPKGSGFVVEGGSWMGERCTEKSWVWFCASAVWFCG